MVYDRRYEDKTLRFEPSGGLLKASLVMRDRETDSWWPIMVGKAIAGPLTGASLKELSVSEKTTWGAWRRKHTASLVLAEGGRTHAPLNHYDDYFSSDRTFQNTQVEDRRLPAKAPIFAFRIDERAYAVPLGLIEGGTLMTLRDDPDHDVYLVRRPGASIFESTVAYLVPAGLSLHDEGEADPAALERRPGVRRLAGLDTYWYTWVGVNGETELLERAPR